MHREPPPPAEQGGGYFIYNIKSVTQTRSSIWAHYIYIYNEIGFIRLNKHESCTSPLKPGGGIVVFIFLSCTAGQGPATRSWPLVIIKFSFPQPPQACGASPGEDPTALPPLGNGGERINIYIYIYLFEINKDMKKKIYIKNSLDLGNRLHSHYASRVVNSASNLHPNFVTGFSALWWILFRRFARIFPLTPPPRINIYIYLYNCSP